MPPRGHFTPVLSWGRGDGASGALIHPALAGGRRDVYLTRDDHGWHVKTRRGGWDGGEVVHDFTDERDAQAMLLRALETAPGKED